MAKSDALKTERLHIIPLTDEQLQQRLYDAATAAEKRQYSELYAGVRLYPTHRLWCTLWEITLKADGTVVGRLRFGGPATERGEAELLCEIFPAHQGKGYAGEAITAMLKWAWKDERTYFIIARPHNEAYRDTLQKLGFTENGAWYELERPVNPRTQLLMSIGVPIGLFVGLLLLGDYSVGIVIGALGGGMLGWYQDAKDHRIREKLREMRR